MKDQKVFIVALGYNGSQEKHLGELRASVLFDKGWDNGFTLPPLIIAKILPVLPPKQQIAKLLKLGPGSVTISQLEVYENTQKDWYALGARLLVDDVWPKFDRSLAGFSLEYPLPESSPWSTMIRHFGYPYLHLGLGTSKPLKLPEIGERVLTFTRPRLMLIEVDFWTQGPYRWFENLRWTRGFERRMYLSR